MCVCARSDLLPLLLSLRELSGVSSRERLEDIQHGHLKIHDWMVLCGSMQAYFVGQFEGVTEEYKVLLSDYFYMLEVCYRFYCSYVRFDITCYRIALGVATQVLQGGRPRCAPGENRRHSV